ncbi:MAG: ATP-binding protein [Bradymonadaceae bacterium]
MRFEHQPTSFVFSGIELSRCSKQPIRRTPGRCIFTPARLAIGWPYHGSGCVSEGRRYAEPIISLHDRLKTIVSWGYSVMALKRCGMAMEIIDRKQEQAKLHELADEGVPRMALLYGRRRVGKTFLLTHLWSEDRAFYFTASIVTPEQNRRQLIRQVSQWSGEHYEPEDYPTWRTVFKLLLSLKSDRPLVVVLDEFQYLGENEKDLAQVTSELNAVWEGPQRPSRAVLLVLSGSAIRTMEALDAGGAPLHGRLSWKAQLEPFDYLDAALMAPFEDLRDRAYTYGVFGGMPRYLASINPSRSFADNVAELMLSPRGDVRGQVETAILQEQGLRDIPKYLGILRAIGGGRTELSEIAGRAGLAKHTTVREKVERLVELGYVEQQRNFDAPRTTPWRYRLADPAFRFYHEFVTRYETTLEKSDPADVWKAHVAPEIDRYMGHLFERIVEQSYDRKRKTQGLGLVREWGRWEGNDRDGKSLEMDIVSRLTSGAMLTGAIKWTRRPIGNELHRNHMRDLQRLADAGNRWAHEALESGSSILYVSAGGFKEGFRERAEEEGLPVVLWSLEDLYARHGHVRT